MRANHPISGGADCSWRMQMSLPLGQSSCYSAAGHVCDSQVGAAYFEASLEGWGLGRRGNFEVPLPPSQP